MGTKSGTKILYFFDKIFVRMFCRPRFRYGLYGGKNFWMGKSLVWAWFRHTCLSSSMGGRYKIQIPKGWKWRCIFSQQVGEICKSRQSCSSTLATSEAQTPTYVEVVPSFAHCRWMNTSSARQESATLISCTLQCVQTTDRRRTDVAVVCWLPKFHEFETRSTGDEGCTWTRIRRRPIVSIPGTFSLQTLL